MKWDVRWWDNHNTGLPLDWPIRIHHSTLTRIHITTLAQFQLQIRYRIPRDTRLNKRETIYTKNWKKRVNYKTTLRRIHVIRFGLVSSWIEYGWIPGIPGIPWLRWLFHLLWSVCSGEDGGNGGKNGWWEESGKGNAMGGREWGWGMRMGGGWWMMEGRAAWGMRKRKVRRKEMKERKEKRREGKRNKRLMNIV